MDRVAFRDGVRDCAPAVPPSVPYGMLFGAAAVQIGLDPAQATALSLFTFAATAQVAAVDLLNGGAALPVALATLLLINLRYVIYSASLAERLQHLPWYWRAAIAYPLFDVTYALATARFSEARERPADGEAKRSADGEANGHTTDRTGGRPLNGDGGETATDATRRATDRAEPTTGDHPGWYFLGTGLPMVASFVLGTLAGALAGQTLGAGLQLDFAIPLIFVALLVPKLDGEASALAAVTAAVIAVGGANLPFNAGLLFALVAGTLAGTLADRADLSVRGSR